VIDVKTVFEFFGVNSTAETRGSVSARPMERPLLRDFPAGSDYSIITPTNRFRRFYVAGFVVIAFLPSIVALIYCALLVTPRYVSEAKFVVRTAAKPSGSAGLASILQITGLSRSQDDVFSVQDFMTSRDAVEQLLKKRPVGQMYGGTENDFIARYPSVFFGETREDFYKYFQWMIAVSYSNNTGISTLRVQAFRSADAHAIAQALLEISEQLVNKLNDRIYQDAVTVSAAQVALGEKRLIAAQIALTDFRNREVMIDPGSSSVVISEVVKRLSNSLAETQTEIRQMRTASPGNPQLANLQQREAALITQITRERTRISSSSDGLADKMANFERLTLEVEFAKQALTTATSALENARVEARRQQLYLERVVEPNLSDYATAPSSLRWISTVFGANLLGNLVLWLFVTGIREHAAASH